MSNIIEEPRFKFGGKTSDFKDKVERNFEKAHLKAYLRGDLKFTHGRYQEDYKDSNGNILRFKGDMIEYAVKRVKA